MRSETGRDKQVIGFAQFCLGHLQEESGLTVRQISKKTKLCQSTIYKLRKGRCSTRTQIGTIQKLSAATGCKLSLINIE